MNYPFIPSHIIHLIKLKDKKIMYDFLNLNKDIRTGKLLNLEQIGQIYKCPFTVTKWAASWQNQQSGYVHNNDSDQPGHPPSLIRVFAVRSMGS